MTGCIIGSFRKYYDNIVSAIHIFEKSGHTILSPKKSMIQKNEDGFVILLSDNPTYSHVDIQTLVFHRAFRSDFVYVWNPNGYIGKTTGYEIGRLVERKIPLYYKEPPVDIPLYVPEGSIIGVEEFVSCIEKNKQLPPYGEENNLITKKLLTDLENNKFHL